MTEQSVLSAAKSLLALNVPALKTIVDASERRAGGALGSAILPDEVPIALLLPTDVTEVRMATGVREHHFDLQVHLVHYYPSEIGSASDFRTNLVTPVETVFRMNPQLDRLADTTTTKLRVCGDGQRGIRTRVYGYWTGSQYARQAFVNVEMNDWVFE